MKFTKLNINKKLIDKTSELGFKELTQIQLKCIPEISKGQDVVGQGETGSGKTIAFTLPILNKIRTGKGIQAIIITPTRELCSQVADVFNDFGKALGIKTTKIFGGVAISPQINNLKKSEIVVGTPGRLLDHIGRGTIDLMRVRFLVLDETDKMFEMGFIDDVEKIISNIPKNRQTLMFSATISDSIHSIINKHLNKPLIIKTKSHVDRTKLRQVYYDIYKQNNKFSLLVHLLKNNTIGLSIVFCATRVESDILSKNLRHQGINSSAIHGGMSQNKRTQTLEKLRNEKTQVLVATDVAARGLDVKNVTHIYNYDVPGSSTEYIHRIGRTARAGENGKAITLLTKKDHDNFRKVQSNEKLVIEKAEAPDFEKVYFKRMFEQKKRSFQRKNYKSYRQKPRSSHRFIKGNNRKFM